MTTAFFSHDDCMKHNMGPEHPESPERISTILAYLADTHLEQDLDWVRPEEITRDQLLMVHPETYLQQLDMMQFQGLWLLKCFLENQYLNCLQPQNLCK